MYTGHLNNVTKILHFGIKYLHAILKQSEPIEIMKLNHKYKISCFVQLYHFHSFIIVYVYACVFVYTNARFSNQLEMPNL